MRVTDTDPFEPVDGNCNARKTNGEGLCRHTAGWRTDHVGIGSCRYHGGNTPNAQVHAARVRHARELQELLAEHLAGVDVVDPLKAVMEVVRSTWAWRRVLEMRAAELADRTEDPDGLPLEALYGPNHQGDSTPHVLVGMLERATTQHLQACKVALDHGVAEAMIRIEEDKLEVLATALRGIVADLGHSLDDPGVQEVVVRHLTVVGGTAAA